VVSDRNSYALQLTHALAGLPHVRCLFYGPRKLPMGRVIEFGGFENDKPVWTTYRYALQILSQCLRDKPHIVHFDFTLTIFGNTYLSSIFLVPLVTLLRLFGYKVVISVHDTVTKQVLSEFFGTRNLRKYFAWLTSLVFYKFLSIANVLIVHLNFQKQLLVTMNYINPNKIFPVPFGVAEMPVIPNAKLNLWKQKFPKKRIVLFFGNIAPRKGVEFLIDGFSLIADKHPDSCLIIGGGADSRSQSYLSDLLERASQKITSASFSYLGYLKDIDAHSLIELSEVMVLPYVYAHASPSILYWAIQHHKPVVASKISTLYEELKGYPEKLLVPPSDSGQIAKALEEALTDNELLAKATRFMASKASSISWNRTREDIYRIYLSLMQRV
jgi:glycosyltransferase involved in cell wall biosynthesis